MDYARPELADRLAAGYVLGTLRGPARRRFEALLAAHPALRAAVERWRDRLAPLADTVPPVVPPQRVWVGIERRLFAAAAASAPAPAPVAAAPVRWWHRLGLWRGLAAVTTAVAVALVLRATQVPAPEPPTVVVLAANPEVAAAVAGTRFVVSLSGDGRALVLRPLDAPALTAAQALELWALPADGAPRSLGLVRADAATTVVRARSLLHEAAGFAVSIEPAGGSPTGAPTGPIVSLGRLGT